MYSRQTIGCFARVRRLTETTNTFSTSGTRRVGCGGRYRITTSYARLEIMLKKRMNHDGNPPTAICPDQLQSHLFFRPNWIHRSGSSSHGTTNRHTWKLPEKQSHSYYKFLQIRLVQSWVIPENPDFYLPRKTEIARKQH